LTSDSEKPSILLKAGEMEMLSPRLKPLVTSSIVTGDTPVTNILARPEPVPEVNKLQISKKLFKIACLSGDSFILPFAKISE
jgi:biotin synthase-related radical SAM superfamily protein